MSRLRKPSKRNPHTAAAHAAKRTRYSRQFARILPMLKNIDGIWIFCNTSGATRIRSGDDRRAGREAQIALTLIATYRHVLQNFFAQNCLRGGRAHRNRSKNAESVPSDSRLKRHPRCFDPPSTTVRVAFARCRARPYHHRARPAARRADDDLHARSRAIRQTPSLAFRRSLTACGLALPPDAFIT